MTCDDVKVDLMAWQLGELHGDARATLEAHVLECASCVKAFVEVKRAVELAEDGPAPSTSARVTLRAAVRDEFFAAAWWERPVAFFFASVSVVAAVVLVMP